MIGIGDWKCEIQILLESNCQSLTIDWNSKDSVQRVDKFLEIVQYGKVLDY